MPRVAFFPDSFHEVNGVAHTARQYVSYAQRRSLPMLCVRAGASGQRVVDEGSVRSLELDRGHWSVRLEEDLSFDPFFFRHLQAVARELRRFRPDIIHITGPSELGLLGAFFSRWFEIPLAASWHTNVHQYAGRRLAAQVPGLGRVADRAGRLTESLALTIVARLYRQASVLFAPNAELCALLEERSSKPVHLMQRGVDTALFSPRSPGSQAKGAWMLGYVGRLSVEKNVALLPRLHEQLRSFGITPRWLIVGHGSEERALRERLGNAAHFAGVLHGQALAEAYRRMDLFVFPSHTDTFGNVVLEALASGVPAVVTPEGGPASIVRHGITGCVVAERGFAVAIVSLLQSPGKREEVTKAARQYALGCSWDSVFDRVVASYTSGGLVAPGFAHTFSPSCSKPKQSGMRR